MDGESTDLVGQQTSPKYSENSTFKSSVQDSPIMKGFFFAGMFFFALVFAYGQKITVSGKVIDKGTREPLPFASVWIRGKPIGTITNLQGEFDFHLPSEYRNEMMVVSMLGHLSYETPVWSMLNQSQAIELEETTQVLNEVVVSDSLMSGDILRIALSRIDQNFPLVPFAVVFSTRHTNHRPPDGFDFILSGDLYDGLEKRQQMGPEENEDDENAKRFK